MKPRFYETDQALSEYLMLHYGEPDLFLPYTFGPANALAFPINCVKGCLDILKLPAHSRALDLGCAVGRSSFELARHCQEVVGIDGSEQFIRVAQKLQSEGTFAFTYAEEGDLQFEATAVVPLEIDRRRVTFRLGDAEDLSPNLGQFDVILMANLIDRLPNPRHCLIRLPGFVNAGGQLIITSPYSWRAEFTPKENWLGGFVRGGKPVRTLDTLKEILSPYFQLVGCRDMPFLIREHARKFQWSVAESSLWIRI